MAPAFAAAEAAAQDIPIITIPGTSNTHILNAGGETVVPDSFDLGAFLKDDERYPQFMHKDAEGRVVPLTENDPSDAKWARKNPFTALFDLWKAMFRLLRNALRDRLAA